MEGWWPWGWVPRHIATVLTTPQLQHVQAHSPFPPNAMPEWYT